MTKLAKEGESTSADAALHKVHDGQIKKEEPAQPPRQRIKNNKYAILLGYQGKNYYGMQIQKDMPTIESHVLDSMYKLGWITEGMRETPFDFYFQRAARTDRAVSAVRQIISCQLPRHLDLPIIGPGQINDLLPTDIRVFGIRRTTTSFHAQKNCDARTYSYTLPTFAFAKADELTDGSFRIRREVIDEVNAVLAQYVGTHNFFNYTSKKSFSDRSCNRYIISFTCGEPFLVEDPVRGGEVEFIACTVKGQSFMLHQIRKMIGMMITIVRELQTKGAIAKSFEGERMDVPKAPGLGLLLERLHYEKYDRMFGSKEPHSPLTNWGEEIECEVEKMKKEHIISEITSSELTSHSMMEWLASLVTHDFASSDDEDIPHKSFLTMANAKARESEKELATANNEMKVELVDEKSIVNELQDEGRSPIIGKEEELQPIDVKREATAS